jgi:molybdate transport system substrate-binding protein
MPAQVMRRRWLLAGAPTLVLASVPAWGAGGDLAVTCDSTLAPALRKVADAYKARFSSHVFIFPTGPGLILPQLVRDIQNDIVVTQTAILEQAAEASVIAAPVHAQWRNPLVIAGRGGGAMVDGAFAVTDPSPASDIDGPALLARLAIKPARTLGAVDTDEVAFLLATGAAQAGLLHMTDVRANPRLEVIRLVPTDIHPPIIYAASVTRLARRPNPEGFVSFLAAPEATALLAEGGLETHA